MLFRSGGDAGVGGVGLAGLVFFMPEVEVGAMVGEGGFDESRGRAGPLEGPGIGTVPAEGGLVVEARDFEDVEHRLWVGCGD